MTDIERLEKKKWKAEEMPDQTGKIVIITGANSGLGFGASRELARKGAKVILACRSLEKAEEAILEIREEIPDADVEAMELNLASLDSVRSFVEQFKEKYDRLDILINNAGVMQPPYMETEDKLELQMGVNHFAHFALTAGLMGLIKGTPGSRIINQSSVAHTRAGRFDFESINNEEKYGRTKTYSTSKLANLLFTYELDRRLKENSIDAIAIGVHPGYTTTKLQHNGPTIGGKSKFSRMYTVTNKLIAQDLSKGILPMLYAATESDVNGGDYIGCKSRLLGQMRGYPQRVKSHKHSYNEEDAKRLWDLSEEITQVKFEI